MGTMNIIELEEGWEIIQNEITKLINTLEGVPDSPNFGSIYTTIFNMCGQKPPYDCSGKLYERYKGVFYDYLTCKVLPAIQEKQDDVSMLQELIKRWENHKVMVTKLSRYFNYLDRGHIPRRMAIEGLYIPALREVGFGCFREIVYEKMKVRIRVAVIALINREREGNEIDRKLVKDVLEIFVEIGYEYGKEDNLGCYVNDFETAFLSDMVDYYTRRGSNEIRVAECFQREKDRVSHYLHSSTEEKLLKLVLEKEMEHMTLSDTN